MSWEKDVRRWVDAQIVDTVTVERIRQFEQNSGRRRLHLPSILAVGFGVLTLCAGVLLFVASHWDHFSPEQRFLLVLAMVVAFHGAASLLSAKAPVVGTGLHVAGTVSLGAGIFLAGQIFNLEEHWPGGLMLWALGALLAWLILRQWPQALLAAILIPAWLGGEWSLATEKYSSAWNIAAQGLLLLSLFYFSESDRDSGKPLRQGLNWAGGLFLIPLLADVMWSGNPSWNRGYYRSQPPVSLTFSGYAGAYLPVLAMAVFYRKKSFFPVFAAAAWVFVLGILSRAHSP
ncbi:MAG TPA: DUF2157 domain-containing protein [Candidatus Angelobacter sp.]|nr:DUF2157 domain-containing protein [Candidatus Angelobacter sp.]